MAENFAFDETSLAELKVQAEGDFYFFCKAILGYRELVPRVHGPLTLELESHERGEIQNLLVVLPRGWFKTTVTTIAYSIWRAVKNPEIRILIVQNTYTNAQSKLSSIGQQIKTNQLLRRLWPEVIPTREQTWKSDAMCLNRKSTWPECTFECGGTNTDFVSRHYDLIIQDDTVAPDLDEMGEENLLPTKDDVDQAIGFHKLTLPLLDNPGKSQIIVIGTRWFDKDLIAFIKENEPGFKVYERACREKDGKPHPNGEITFPERFPESVLETIAARMGPYLFSCLYLNTPMQNKDMIFQPDWFMYFETAPRLCDLDVYISIDPNGSDGTKALGKDPDSSVIMVTGKHKSTGFIYVLDYWTHKQCDPESMITQLFKMVLFWEPLKVVVETFAYQKTLMFWIKRLMFERNVFFSIHEIKGKPDARIMGLQPLVKAGVLLFKLSQRELILELQAYPSPSAHDDLIDALSMCLTVWNTVHEKLLQLASRADFSKFDYNLDDLLVEIKGKSRGSGQGILDDSFDNEPFFLNY